MGWDEADHQSEEFSGGTLEMLQMDTQIDRLRKKAGSRILEKILGMYGMLDIYQVLPVVTFLDVLSPRVK